MIPERARDTRLWSAVGGMRMAAKRDKASQRFDFVTRRLSRWHVLAQSKFEPGGKVHRLCQRLTAFAAFIRGGPNWNCLRLRVQKRSDADQEKSLGTDCRRHGDTLKEPITWAHARAGAPLAAHARSILVVPSPSPPTTRPYSRQVSSALLPPKSRHVAVTYPPWSRHVSTLHTDICRMSPLRCHRCTSCSATPPPSRSFPLP